MLNKPIFRGMMEGLKIVCGETEVYAFTIREKDI